MTLEAFLNTYWYVYPLGILVACFIAALSTEVECTLSNVSGVWIVATLWPVLVVLTISMAICLGPIKLGQYIRRLIYDR